MKRRSFFCFAAITFLFIYCSHVENQPVAAVDSPVKNSDDRALLGDSLPSLVKETKQVYDACSDTVFARTGKDIWFKVSDNCVGCSEVIMNREELNRQGMGVNSTGYSNVAAIIPVPMEKRTVYFNMYCKNYPDSIMHHTVVVIR